MSDFPVHLGGEGARGVLTAMSGSLGTYGTRDGSTYGNTTTVWTANRAVYCPVLVPRPLTVYTIQIRVMTQAGNIDVGIYNWNNTKVISSGSTACAAAGVQAVDITDTTLAPGWYKLAFASNSSTAVFRQSAISIATMRVMGFQQQSTAFALPDPLTPVAYATALAPLITATYRATF